MSYQNQNELENTRIRIISSKNEEGTKKVGYLDRTDISYELKTLFLETLSGGHFETVHHTEKFIKPKILEFVKRTSK